MQFSSEQWPREDQSVYLDPTSVEPEEKIQYRNPTDVRVKEPEIAILAQYSVTCEDQIDIMDIMEPSSQTLATIHTLLISYLQSCLLVVQKQRDKQKNFLPPLMPQVGNASRDKGMGLSGDEKGGHGW